MAASIHMTSGVRLVHVVTVPMSLRLLRGQLAQMRAWGLEVSCISAGGEYQQVVQRDEGVEVIAIPMTRRITPLRDIWAIARLVRELRRIRPHIVHAHTPKGGLLGMIAATIARVPVRVYHMRGLPLMTASGSKRRLLAMTEHASCTLAHRVLCVSHALRAFAVAEGLVSADKIVTPLGGSGNGVDATGQFNPSVPAGDRAARRAAIRASIGIPAAATVVAYVGRVVADKGVADLAFAWAKSAARWPSAHLLVAGPVEAEDPIPTDAMAILRSHPTIHFADREVDARDIYSAADLVVLPTYREGMPNVPLEAAAMLLPVVATNIPGCAEAVADGETGTLVPPRNPDALAAAIDRYIEDAELRRRHGNAGRERVLAQFRREQIWSAVLQEYERLLAARGLGVISPVVARSAPG